MRARRRRARSGNTWCIPRGAPPKNNTHPHYTQPYSHPRVHGGGGGGTVCNIQSTTTFHARFRGDGAGVSAGKLSFIKPRRARRAQGRPRNRNALIHARAPRRARVKLLFVCVLLWDDDVMCGVCVVRLHRGRRMHTLHYLLSLFVWLLGIYYSIIITFLGMRCIIINNLVRMP